LARPHILLFGSFTHLSPFFLSQVVASLRYSGLSTLSQTLLGKPLDKSMQVQHVAPVALLGIAQDDVFSVADIRAARVWTKF